MRHRGAGILSDGRIAAARRSGLEPHNRQEGRKGGGQEGTGEEQSEGGAERGRKEPVIGAVVKFGLIVYGIRWKFFQWGGGVGGGVFFFSLHLKNSSDLLLVNG